MCARVLKCAKISPPLQMKQKTLSSTNLLSKDERSFVPSGTNTYHSLMTDFIFFDVSS